MGFKRSKRTDRPAPRVQKRADMRIERRGEQRQEAFKNAQLFIHKDQSVACAVCDVSESGCQIALYGADTLPDEVEIRIAPYLPRQRARVAWQKAREAGLEFVTA